MEEDVNDLRYNLDFTAAELRRYYQEKTGKTVFCTERYQQIFKDVASQAIKLNARPEEFIDAQLSAIGKDRMQVAMLLGKKSVEHYQTYMNRTKLPLPELYEIQKRYLRIQIVQAKRTVEQALMDDDLKFQPWFRICITKEPVKEIIDKYKEEAKEDMNAPLRAFLIERKLDVTRITNE